MKKILLLSDTHSHIDDTILKYVTQADEVWHAGDIVDVWMTHIGGYPGKYNPNIKAEMTANPPKLFICGHSHILKVIFDKKNNLLHMNPGAAGKSGFHQVRTMLRFVIDGDKIKDLEIVEIGKK